MSFKLTPEEIKQKEELTASLKDVGGELETQVNIYNEILANTSLFVEKVGTRLREEFDSKSGKWQESSEGADVGAMIDEWEIEVDQVEFIDISDTIERLPVEPVESAE
jgi:hypothetical protein